MNLGPTELIIIAVVILALFGYKKLPDAARAIGRSARIIKAETKGLRDDPAPRDLQARAEAEYTSTPPAPPAAAPTPPPAAPAAPPAAAPAPPVAEAAPQQPVHVPPPSDNR
jgi:sec-independent protein translocase protein TatA